MDLSAKEKGNLKREGVNNRNNSASYFRLYNTPSSLLEIMIENQLRNDQKWS